MTTPEEAFDILRQEMIDDDDYAWGWHCNIAVPFMDEGGTHEAANKAAARAMYNIFSIDTSKNRHYIY